MRAWTSRRARSTRSAPCSSSPRRRPLSAGPVASRRLAYRQTLPRKFLEAIVADLKTAGLVKSTRGARGGYAARPRAPRHLASATCSAPSTDRSRRCGACGRTRRQYDGVAEHLPTVWVAVRASLRSVLDETSLADVLSGNLPERVAAAGRRPRRLAQPLTGTDGRPGAGAEPTTAPLDRIDPDDLATALRVLEQLPDLDADHPDIETVKRATGRMYKRVRKARRREARSPQVDARRGGHRRDRHRLARCGSTTRPRASRWSRRVRGAHAGELDQPARLLHLQGASTPSSTRSTTGSAPTAPP